MISLEVVLDGASDPIKTAGLPTGRVEFGEGSQERVMTWNAGRKVQESCEERLFSVTVFLEFGEIIRPSDDGQKSDHNDVDQRMAGVGGSRVFEVLEGVVEAAGQVRVGVQVHLGTLPGHSICVSPARVPPPRRKHRRNR